MEYDSSNEDHTEFMEYLLSEGAAYLDGIDEDGEAIYGFDMDILEEVSPELYQVLMEDMDRELIELYQKGLIEISYDEELNAHMIVSEEGKKALLEAGFDLGDSEENDF